MGSWRMPAEKGRNAALTQEPDPDNAGVGTPQKDPSRHGAWGAFFVASSPVASAAASMAE